MVQITSISDAADQLIALQMPDGSAGTLELIYLASCMRWMFNFTHPQFTSGALNGAGLCVSPNLLRQYMNILTFGMACSTTSGLDPVLNTDFALGNANLYILSQADVAGVESTVYAA